MTLPGRKHPTQPRANGFGSRPARHKRVCAPADKHRVPLISRPGLGAGNVNSGIEPRRQDSGRPFRISLGHGNHDVIPSCRQPIGMFLSKPSSLCCLAWGVWAGSSSERCPVHPIVIGMHGQGQGITGTRERLLFYSSPPSISSPLNHIRAPEYSLGTQNGYGIATRTAQEQGEGAGEETQAPLSRGQGEAQK